MSDVVVLDGELSLTIPLDGDAELTGALDGESELLDVLDGELGMLTVVERIIGDVYDGETAVDPDFVGIVLPTKYKAMADDVTVNPIQVAEVSNLSGGKTVYIGGII